MRHLMLLGLALSVMIAVKFTPVVSEGGGDDYCLIGGSGGDDFFPNSIGDDGGSGGKDLYPTENAILFAGGGSGGSDEGGSGGDDYCPFPGRLLIVEGGDGGNNFYPSDSRLLCEGSGGDDLYPFDDRIARRRWT